MLNSATVSANICTSRYIQELRNLTFPSSHQTKKGRERYLPLNIPWRLPVQDGLVWPDVVAVPWVVVRVGRGVVWNQHSLDTSQGLSSSQFSSRYSPPPIYTSV